MRVVSMASSSDIGGRIVGMRFASMVFPAPGGPINKMLCPPAQATSSARFADCCPCTSRKSTEYCAASESICRASTFTGVNDSGEFTRSTACGSDFTANTSTPSTTAASFAFASGTASAFNPNSRAASAADSAPRTERTLPSSDSSPRNIILVQLFAEKLSLAAHQTQRHGQIESRPFLPHIRRRQIDRHALPMRKLEPAVSQRALDPLAAFLHRIVRQPHHIKILHARGSHVHLNLHEVGVNSVHRSALRLEEHAGHAWSQRSR